MPLQVEDLFVAEAAVVDAAGSGRGAAASWRSTGLRCEDAAVAAARGAATDGVAALELAGATSLLVVAASVRSRWLR